MLVQVIAYLEDWINILRGGGGAQHPTLHLHGGGRGPHHHLNQEDSGLLLPSSARFVS